MLNIKKRPHLKDELEEKTEPYLDEDANNEYHSDDEETLEVYVSITIMSL